MFCPNCGKEQIDGAKFCQNCGTSIQIQTDVKPNIVQVSPEQAPKNEPVSYQPKILKKPWYTKWWIWVLMGVGTIILFVIIGSVGNNKNTPVSKKQVVFETTAKATEAVEKKAAETLAAAENATEAPRVEKPTEAPRTEAPVQAVPQEYINALQKAESYCNRMYMSKQGVYDQLTSEYGDNFPEDAAQYAIDNVQADWDNNALKKAESYSNNMHMSQKGIYDQLVSEYGEQFTESEAQYAIDNINADWNENALKKAESYYYKMNMSKDSVYDQLISEYGEKFTESEAQYAIDHLAD